MITDNQKAIIDKVEKLLRLAGSNPNEAEASAATAKAQSILAAHNLDLSLVEREGGGDGRRADAWQKGGMYEYQRHLWHAVAELNFCLYFTYRTRTVKGWGWEQRLVGRRVNVAATQAMGGYLMQAIERLTRERLHAQFDRPNNQLWSRWAVSYREGIADRVLDKLYERRNQMQSEERRRAAMAVREATAGVSTATALTLAEVSQRERDANMDFIHGEGYSARKADQRAQAAREAAEAEAEYARWATAHPEEARKQEERRSRAEARRGYGPAPREKDWGAFRAGQEAGEDLGIDPQTEDAPSKRRRLGHG